MRVSSRDLEVLAFVARFGQVTPAHVRRVVFADNASITPMRRVVSRLVEQNLLTTIEKRTVGGERGGSGHHVLQLGSAGWKLAEAEGTYWKARSVNYHSLAIADVYCALYEAQGNYTITRFETEPDTHVKVNYIPLLPDMYVELRLADGRERRVWLEIDLGTERPRQLTDKMNRYHKAWLGATENWNPWPYVIFVVPDERRKVEIERLVAQQPKETHPMYRVSLFGDVVAVTTQ